MRSDSRPMGYCVSDGRKNAHGHESRDARGVESAQPRVDRPHRENERRNHAGHGDGHHAERRIPIQLAKPHLARHGVLGNLARGDHDGHERQGNEHRHHHERRLGGRIGEHQQKLRRAEAYVEHHHVDGEQAAAILAARPIVEPALRDHVNARQAEAGHHAHGAPDERIDQASLNQDRGRRHRGERREHPDMAEPAQQRRSDARARAGSRGNSTT